MSCSLTAMLLSFSATSTTFFSVSFVTLLSTAGASFSSFSSLSSYSKASSSSSSSSSACPLYSLHSSLTYFCESRNFVLNCVASAIHTLNYKYFRLYYVRSRTLTFNTSKFDSKCFTQDCFIGKIRRRGIHKCFVHSEFWFQFH